VHEAALSDTSGTATFHRVRDASTRSSLHSTGAAEDRLSVSVERLDEVLDAGYAPDLIKIDVEGAEGLVLRGAQATLERHRPVVVFEHGAHAERFGMTSEEIHDLLAAAGLRVLDIDGGGPYSRTAFADRVRRGDLWTFVARP
jgi:hypothetical protein